MILKAYYRNLYRLNKVEYKVLEAWRTHEHRHLPAFGVANKSSGRPISFTINLYI